MRWTHITLPFSDLRASLEFFTGVCGLHVVRDRRAEGGGTVWVGPAPVAGRDPEFVLVAFEGPVVEPLDHFGFQCETREQVFAIAESARAAGALLEGPTDDGGSVGLFAVVREPSGHRVEFTHGQPLRGLAGGMHGDTPTAPVRVQGGAPRPIDSSTVLVRALLAYAVHEHHDEQGTATRIELLLQPRACTLIDNGRGIGLHREGYVGGLVEQLALQRSEVALHGLGLAIIATSSPLMVVESRREGRRFTQRFAWGVAQGGVQSEAWAGVSGTRVTFTLADDAPAIDPAQVNAQAEFWRSAHPRLEIAISWEGQGARRVPLEGDDASS